MTTTKNNEHKKLNFSSEREQSQACLNSAEHEKNQGRKVLNVPNKREQNQTCSDSAEREGLCPKGNVPNLRFPEFQGEWEMCTFDKIAQYKKGPFGSALKKDIFVPQSEDTIKVYEQQNAIKKDWTLSRYYITKGYFNSHMKQFVAKAGDLIVSCAGTIGEIYELPQDAEEGVFNQALMRVQVNDEAVNKEIFITVFSSIIDKFSRIYSNGSAIKNIPPFADLKKTQVFLPCKEEQKKIAKLLALLDERIATQNKIIDKLQSLIKGIVDCTILRKEKNAIVGDVCSISEQIRAEANIDDIITVRLHGNGVCKSSAENLQLGATQYYRRRAGQLIYGKQNFHNGAIGIVPISLDNGITSKDIPSFDIDEMKCNSVYLLAQLQSPQYYKPAEALTTGTGSKRLKEETFLKMPIVLPNKREQDNIAVLIHRASMNLDYAKRLLELLSIQKQFLLRQMFI